VALKSESSLRWREGLSAARLGATTRESMSSLNRWSSRWALESAVPPENISWKSRYATDVSRWITWVTYQSFSMNAGRIPLMAAISSSTSLSGCALISNGYIFKTNLSVDPAGYADQPPGGHLGGAACFIVELGP